MPDVGSLKIVRRKYAEMLREKAKLRNQRLVRALAEVPREAFLGRGPWLLTDLSLQYRYTADDNPAHLYQDVLVSIDAARGLNNGMPSGLTRWIDALDLREGETAVHAGCGPGYYTALIASVVGERGRVIAFDLDTDLAQRAKSNLQPFTNVEVLAADASIYDPGPVDAILVNAGATHPLNLWLDSLKEGGRLLFPLVRWPDGAVFGQGMAGWGAMMRIQRLAGDRYDASFAGSVAIFPCFGALDREADRLLEQSWQTPITEVRSLRRDAHEKAPSCWLHGAGYCFSKEAQG
jgi:protein-L-isoaspartate(D-aspartate) O-methyltransferase